MTAPTNEMLMISILGKEMLPEWEFAGKEASEEDLEVVLRLYGKKRRWRFDYAIPSKRIALEIEGGIFVQGRHTRGSGYLKDIEKYNTAVLLDWRVIRSTTSTKSKTAALETIKRLLAN